MLGKTSIQDHPKTFVAIAGNIGAGKTTLTELLSRRFQWRSHFESVSDNPYLEDFYSNMERWSFSLQVYFLNHRFQTHQIITDGTSSAIQDRSIYEDANIFARGLHEQGAMDDRDYRNYVGLYRVMCSYLSAPDLMIYLRKSVPKLQERIALRGRDYEKGIEPEYLTNLNRYYDEWMDQYDLGKKIIIESDDLDPLYNQAHFDEICQKILLKLDQQDLFHQSAMEPTVPTAPELPFTLRRDETVSDPSRPQQAILSD